MRTLVIKTAALGDVLRTTSILPGLRRRYPALDVTWVTAHGAIPLVEHHRLVRGTEGVSPGDAHEVELLGAELVRRPWDRILSFDDEEPLCRMATRLRDAHPDAAFSGAFLAEDGGRAYTDDVAPWFDMGLISRHGKVEADRLKIANVRTHPGIFAGMLGIDIGKPELPLPASARAFAEEFRVARELDRTRPVIGLNTGAGGRWKTKGLPVDRVIRLVRLLSKALAGHATFLVLGGQDEAERNRAILTGLREADVAARVIDGDTRNSLLEFAGLISQCDLVVTSDSMALHMAIALNRKIVSFFAPTSAAEIELYGLGEKVWSTADDYCSYRPDADNSSLTAELLCETTLEVISR